MDISPTQCVEAGLEWTGLWGKNTFMHAPCVGGAVWDSGTCFYLSVSLVSSYPLKPHGRSTNFRGSPLVSWVLVPKWLLQGIWIALLVLFWWLLSYHLLVLRWWLVAIWIWSPCQSVFPLVSPFRIWGPIWGGPLLLWLFAWGVWGLWHGGSSCLVLFGVRWGEHFLLGPLYFCIPVSGLGWYLAIHRFHLARFLLPSARWFVLGVLHRLLRCVP